MKIFELHDTWIDYEVTKLNTVKNFVLIKKIRWMGMIYKGK
jgi:hypothetical protein